MHELPSVRRLRAHEWHTYRSLRLRALADAPDAFVTTLAQAQQRTEEQWSTQLASGASSEAELPLLAELGGAPAGLAWLRIDAHDRTTAHLYQMWVAPEARRRGAGRLLLEEGIRWARSAGVRCIVLGVTCGDTPAARLYSRAGFQCAGEPGPLRPGTPLLAQPMRLDLDARRR